jgi:hypothetical protein
MRDFLRFPIDATDQDRVGIGSIQVEDAPGGANILPIAHTLRLKFTVGDPAAGAPRLRPLFPGRLVFIPDPADAGLQPTPEQVDFAQFATWRTSGSLMVIHVFDKPERDLKNLAVPALAVAPNLIWYSKIHLPKEFLQTTLAAHKQPIPGVDVAPTSPDWIKHAVAGFLKGTFLPELKLGATAAADDAEALPMPLLDMTPQGLVALDIATARGQAPRDAPDSAFDAIAAGVSSADPRHPRNGRIPARLALRALRTKMIDGGPGASVPNAMIEPADDLSYVTIRFTRIWKPEEDASAYFPGHTVEVGKTDPVGHLFTGRLPAHGIFYVPVKVDEYPLEITVKITGPMRWVDGRDHTGCFRKIGGTPQFTFTMPGTPHIQMRRRMSEEMTIEATATTPSNACTYYSLRRTVRALVNNRIAGGRLNRDPAHTSKEVAKLIDDAFGAGNSANASSSILANNLPRTSVPKTDEIRAAALTLIPILDMLFSGNAPAQVLNGSASPVTPITNGRLFYDLWQSAASRFEDPNLARNYPDAYIGRGAPGALVALGLASYHVTGERNAGEADESYWDRQVRGLLTGMSAGDLIQLWAMETDFIRIKGRLWTTTTHDSYGHSPVFHSTGTSGGSQIVTVYDQYGTSPCTVIDTAGKLTLSWRMQDPADPQPEQVWVAANWIE